jgi:hypothetical protein
MDIVQVMSNNCSDDTSFIGIGRYDAENLFRILFKISMNKIPQNAIIVDATLIINIKHVESGYPNIITPYALMENWELENVTWDNQPYFNTRIFGESLNVRKRSQCKLKITSIIEKWYKNEISNYGIILKNDEIQDKTISKIVADMESTYRPIIKISYLLKNPVEKDPFEKCPTEFTEKVEEFNTDDLFRFSTLINTSLKTTVIFLVKNLGINTITAHLQISPDGINFIDEPFIASIEMNEIKYLVPSIFSKFTRIAVKNVNANKSSRVKVWYQAQGCFF